MVPNTVIDATATKMFSSFALVMAPTVSIAAAPQIEVPVAMSNVELGLTLRIRPIKRVKKKVRISGTKAMTIPCHPKPKMVSTVILMPSRATAKRKICLIEKKIPGL